ncbi:FabD/lysophospholipase-like protein [Stemphylium lycopersici]|uniref:FabD/lysophospholipase-like protein n=1 Tax=Stemphylium lycopersici TaxID=183478 RepID=A0A364N3J7_STELY|nr:FabD/lysophospholipase-like protein [Stemphylium lycopersici]RAR11029.1 FabD/lysophospholipase-like protein [Stemphylium lycopersici]
MSWTLVDFSCVRYSPVEGTHYFHDPTYPSSIQFLLSGRWEPWDVSYVKYKAQDPDIRRVAQEAETRLVRDPYSGYSPWPSPPPSTAPPPLAPVCGHSRTQPVVTQSAAAEFVTPSPSTVVEHAISTSPRDHSTPSSATTATTYASPYSHQPVAQNASANSPPKSANLLQPAPMKNALPQNTNGHRSPSQHSDLPYDPALQDPSLKPVMPAQAILSRTRETKILLSIDGDGIRGLSALLLVESLVNAICVKLGQRLDCHQIFDLTGGSSLGGVIAIMLCRLRMQAHRAREAYKQIARQVYANKTDYFRYLDPHATIRRVDDGALEREVKNVVQQELGNPDEILLDGRSDSGDVFAITTQMDIGTNRAALIRSYQTRRITGPDLEPNMPIWQALKATSAAPRYIQPEPGVPQRFVIDKGLVDHGTTKNNPVRDILYECRKLFRYANDMMIIVSVGTGVGLDRTKETPEMANSVLDRKAEARGWGEKFEADHAALMERGWMKYFRFDVTGLEGVPLEEWSHEDLIKEKTSAYLAQPEVGQRFYACVDAITALLLSPQGR